ncbi:hypothetical protein [Paenibacillus radicis (ex Xue et al. 2023)]|uniref:Uncharacterized protein n=1 Tax=Paenibacillus radicis (ex Xue et al. 2023) TaxID=2972489 RepID=A0ABT1YH36_9BACL|nr:hypothetical protein [Paenibacillus radicis (ex Xue et al. 2023)]MCR8632524.1 hypothetical protein [Paenibacillus radicis (ex Xue et al. 2023)]
MNPTSKAIKRILDELGNQELLDELSKELSLSDLNTLLLELFRQRTLDTSYADLLRAYSTNRFVQPAQLDPLALKRLELHILTIAQQASYQAIQLSPVAPLGSCSVVATSDQNKIISSLRGTEVVADATNLLALHICDLLKEKKAANDVNPIRFSTTHRHVRAQNFNRPGLLPHFHLYAMVSSGKDKGSYSFEKQTLLEHILVYQSIFSSLYHTDVTVKLNRRDGYTDSEGLLQRLSEHLQEAAPAISVIVNMDENSNQYYKGLQFTVTVTIKGQELNIGDGGFVDWSQKLLGSKKERMMISAIGLDRLI